MRGSEAGEVASVPCSEGKAACKRNDKQGCTCFRYITWVGTWRTDWGSCKTKAGDHVKKMQPDLVTRWGRGL